MSAIPQPNPHVERILEPLRQVSHRQWSVLAVKGMLQVLLVAMALVLGVSLAIAPFNYAGVPATGARHRFAADAGAGVLGDGSVPGPALRRRSIVQTAMDVERRMAPTCDTHERITSAIELSTERDDRFRGSPDLVNHLMEQAEADAALVNPQKLIPGKVVMRLGILLLPLLIAWVVMMLLMPQRMLGSLFHLVIPWKGLPPVLCDVVVQPGDVVLRREIGSKWSRTSIRAVHQTPTSR